MKATKLTAAVLACLTLLCSCGDDEDDYDNDFYGNPKNETYTTNIYGLIVDSNTSEPIRGASVKIARAAGLYGDEWELMSSTVTYDDGRFAFRNFTYDTYNVDEYYSYQYRLEITHPGYTDLTHLISLQKGETNVDLSLKPVDVIVKIVEIDKIMTNTASVQGAISTTGSVLPEFSERGFVVSDRTAKPALTDDPEFTKTFKVGGKTSEDFSCILSGLTPETQYFVRAYIVMESTVKYSDALSFHTDTDKEWITIDNMMVTRYDINSGATHDKAVQVCNDCTIGGFTDWRLPSSEELNAVLQNHERLGINPNVNYWSNTVKNSYTNGSYSYYYGFVSSVSKITIGATMDYSECRVRAVRTIK